MNLSSLNTQQKEAVEHLDGPLLILAGAGSGKTRVLTHRIAHILEQKRAHPNEILAVTFTNKAAGEMRERISKLRASGTSAKNSSHENRISNFALPFAGTFHSNCVKILRVDGGQIGIDPNFTIYDADDQISAVKQTMKELHIDTKEVNPNMVRNYISDAKNQLIQPDEYEQYAQSHLQEAVTMVYPKYDALLKLNNALDFDDLIGKTVQLFRESNAALQKYQNLFKYILVDEYQDTNHAQYVFVNLIAKAHRNICVVGDDDQSIYGWRGANIQNILSFEKDYPEATVVKLEQNYRSTKIILDAAFEVIKHNQGRKPKKLWTEQDGGQPVTIYTAYDEKDEADYIAQEVKVMHRNGTRLSDIAVLYRTNAQSRTLEEMFLTHGIPYRIYGSISFYSRKEIKDVLAYLRILYNPSDNMSLKRIINTPSRKIGAKTIEQLESVAKEQNVSIAELLLQVAKKNKKIDINNSAVGDFAKLLASLKDAATELNVRELIQRLLEESGYIKWLDDGSNENEARIENIKELLTVADKYSDVDPQTGLSEFLNEVSLIEEQQLRAQQDREGDTVSMMTLHSAKGLEFEHVYIIGMEEGLFPHSRSYTDPQELEEERRLAYVGITRAKTNLILTHAESRRYFGSRQANLPSRFLDDIPDRLVTRENWNGSNDESEEYSKDTSDSDISDSYTHKISLEKGQRVQHEQFGNGVVLGIKDDIVTIDFGPIEGVKKLSTEYTRLHSSN